MFAQLLTDEGKRQGGYFATRSKSSFKKYRKGENMLDFIPYISPYYDREQFSEYLYQDFGYEGIMHLTEYLEPYCPDMDLDRSLKDVAYEIADLFVELLERTYHTLKQAKKEKKASKKQAQTVSLKAAYCAGKQDPRLLFPPQAHYIPPEDSLKDLRDHAFMQSNVHAITGRRGMGKTLLAQYFARICCLDSNVREELRYETIIKVDASDKSLRDAIISIPCEGRVKAEWNYEEQIKLLKKQKKPCLIIIDNYDDESKYAVDLSAGNPDYLDLISTECHILFTSKLDLENCHCVYRTKVEPLSLPLQFRLFCQVAQDLVDPESDRERIHHLLTRCLLGNTYLIVLAAELMQTRTLDELTEAFHNLHVGKIRDLVSANKDGRKQEEASLMDHFKLMFDLSGIAGDDCKLRCLYNMAMLPLEGILYNTFIQCAFRPEEQDAMRCVCKQLRNSLWILMEDRKVRLHPMVREMVLMELPTQPFAVVAKLVRSITELLHAEVYSDHTVSDLNCGIAAYKGCKMQRYQTFDTAFLISQISSNYDILRSVDNAYSFGIEALEALRPYDNSEDISQQLILADCYNVVGYAILHAWSRQEDAKSLAETAFRKALDLATALENTQHASRACLLRTKIRGNIAAWHLTQGEYATALEIHSEEKKLREELVKAEPSPQKRCALASSYKGIATAHFYLSRKTTEETAIRNLRESLENHYRAASIYEDVLSEENLETSTAYNRLVGTGITLLERLGASAESEAVEEEISDYLGKMDSVASYLRTIPFVESETKECICHTARLANIMNARNITNPQLWEKVVDIADITDQLDEERKWKNQIQEIRELACV